MATLVGYAEWIQVAACLLVLVEASRRAEAAGLDALVAYAAGVGGLAGAFVGGHLFVVLTDPAALAADPGRLWAVMDTPKAAFGAFGGAAIGAAGVLRGLRQPILTYAEATMPALFLGYAVYRIGCALQGCEVGLVTDGPWGVAYPPGTGVHAAHLADGWMGPASPSLPVHPIGGYHAILGVVLYGALRAEPFGTGRGEQVLLAVGGYGAARLLLETLRQEPMLAAGLTLGQWSSLAALAVAFVGGVYLVRWSAESSVPTPPAPSGNCSRVNAPPVRTRAADDEPAPTRMRPSSARRER